MLKLPRSIFPSLFPSLAPSFSPPCLLLPNPTPLISPFLRLPRFSSFHSRLSLSHSFPLNLPLLLRFLSPTSLSPSFPPSRFLTLPPYFPFPLSHSNSLSLPPISSFPLLRSLLPFLFPSYPFSNLCFLSSCLLRSNLFLPPSFFSSLFSFLPPSTPPPFLPPSLPHPLFPFLLPFFLPFSHPSFLLLPSSAPSAEGGRVRTGERERDHSLRKPRQRYLRG